MTFPKSWSPGLDQPRWIAESPPCVLPDPSAGSQIYRLLAKFMYEGQASDIAGFVVLGDYLVN